MGLQFLYCPFKRWPAFPQSLVYQDVMPEYTILFPFSQAEHKLGLLVLCARAQVKVMSPLHLLNLVLYNKNLALNQSKCVQETRGSSQRTVFILELSLAVHFTISSEEIMNLRTLKPSTPHSNIAFLHSYWAKREMEIRHIPLACLFLEGGMHNF